jgi:hypothetical protein
MAGEIATREPTALAQRYELEVEDLVRQVEKIQRLMKSLLKEGEHFGVIPGTGTKPTLLKPGAEKLAMMFRLDPQYQSVETHDGRHLTVKTTCTLWHIPTGQRWGSGEGSCSTKESKYAYRQAKRVCPKCGADAILRSKFSPKGRPDLEPGWYCHTKLKGCGQEYDANDPFVVGQMTGRVDNDDVADQYNTVLKMANKRALVAAVLNVTAASDIFTQDIEDAPPPAERQGPRVIDAEPVRPIAQDADDRQLLLDTIAQSARRLKFTKRDYKLAWDMHVGGLSEQSASFEALLSLNTYLKNLEHGDPATERVTEVSPAGTVPF